MSKKQKCIISVAVTGDLTTKNHHHNLPIHPEEIVDSVYECWEAGAALVHLHTRDDQGNLTLDVSKFAEILEGIRERCDIITRGLAKDINVEIATAEEARQKLNTNLQIA